MAEDRIAEHAEYSPPPLEPLTAEGPVPFQPPITFVVGFSPALRTLLLDAAAAQGLDPASWVEATIGDLLLERAGASKADEAAEAG